MSRITTKQFMELMGIENEDQFIDYIAQAVCDGETNAMCEDLCTVEPDGCCEHGNPSILLSLGIH